MLESWKSIIILLGFCLLLLEELHDGYFIRIVTFIMHFFKIPSSLGGFSNKDFPTGLYVYNCLGFFIIFGGHSSVTWDRDEGWMAFSSFGCFFL